jgi:hypothetical protein
MAVRTYGSKALARRQAEAEREDPERVERIRALVALLPPIARPRYPSDDRWTWARRWRRVAALYRRRGWPLPLPEVAGVCPRIDS